MLQIPYLCINGDLKMKRDNLVGDYLDGPRRAPVPLTLRKRRDTKHALRCKAASGEQVLGCLLLNGLPLLSLCRSPLSFMQTS